MERAYAAMMTALYVRVREAVHANRQCFVFTHAFPLLRDAQMFARAARDLDARGVTLAEAPLFIMGRYVFALSYMGNRHPYAPGHARFKRAC